MLYLLTVISNDNYDTYDEKLVRAPCPRMARVEANKRTAGEGKIWEDPDKVHCQKVVESGPTEVILASFNAS